MRAIIRSIGNYSSKYLHTSILAYFYQRISHGNHTVILSVVAKSNRILGLMKRTFGKYSKALLTGYKVTVYLIDKLESVHHNAT